MKLLAISGGPDSMFLLHKYRHKKIVVAHVNYHMRSNSDQDQAIVEKFCQQYEIPCEILQAQPIKKGNFQDRARKIRYQFFTKIYQKYQCRQLLLAHHKDDFLETALMQQQSKRLPAQFGIAKRKKLHDMKIYRPLIDLFDKAEILTLVKKLKLPYAHDETNDKPIYERNKIRLDLKKKSAKEKEQMYQWFILANKILKKKHRRINKVYQKWQTSNFALTKFRALDRDKVHLVYLYVHHNFKDVKVSQAKLESLVAFIEGSKGQVAFKLNENNSIKKENGFLVKKITLKSKK